MRYTLYALYQIHVLIKDVGKQSKTLVIRRSFATGAAAAAALRVNACSLRRSPLWRASERARARARRRRRISSRRPVTGLV